MRNRRILPAIRARTSCPFSSSTLEVAVAQDVVDPSFELQWFFFSQKASLSCPEAPRR